MRQAAGCRGRVLLVMEIEDADGVISRDGGEDAGLGLGDAVDLLVVGD